MKGFLSKLGGPPASSSMSSSSSTSAGASHDAGGGGFIGRTFHLHRYQLVVEEKIAEGGFAVVFKVRSTQDGRIFALKRMCVNNENSLQICQREITIVRSLTHKNIIKYVDDCVNHLPNGVYEVLLLMTYCKKTVVGQLNDCAQSGGHLTESHILRIFCDVCEAVSRLHHCHTPVQHRDLKVENVLIDDSGNYVLCDFGSATVRVLQPAVQGAAPVEEEIQKYTTLAYRSPEMVDPYSGRPIGTKADIWALGCMLYKLAYFSLPFGESTLAISSGRLCLPDRPEYSVELRKLIRYALQPDPSLRPDIFQICHLAFQLAGRVNPVQNVNKSEIPRFDILNAPPTESENRREISKSPSVGRIATQSASTVAPRPPLVAGVVQQKPPQPPPQQHQPQQHQPQQHQPQQLPQASSSASAGSPIKAAPPFPTATAAAAAAADAALNKSTVRQRPRPSQAQQQQQKQTLKQPWVTLEPQQQTSSSAAASATAAAAAPAQPSAGNRSSSLFDVRSQQSGSQEQPAFSAAATAAAAAAAAPASSQAGSLDRLRHASQQQQQPPPSIAGWNPFATDDDQHQPETAVGRGASVGTSGAAAADGNSSEDALQDAMFGLEFDRIRRAGSQSSMAAQKSREDLVMEEPDPAFDPFGAAPINPKLKSKHSSGSGGNSASADRSKKSRRSKREQTRARRGEQHHQLHHHHHRADVDWLCAGSDDETACGLDRSGRSDLFAAIPFRKDPDDKSRYEQLDHCYSDEEVLQQSSIANFNFIASDNDNTGSKQLPRQVDCGSAAPAATVVDPVAVPDHQLGAGRHRLRPPSRETSSDGLDEYGTDDGGGGGGGCGPSVGVGARGIPITGGGTGGAPSGAAGGNRLFNYVTLMEDAADAGSLDSRSFELGGGGSSLTADKASVLSFGDYDNGVSGSQVQAPLPAPPQATTDRIVGHQYGVRPLLDDDELSEGERLSDCGGGGGVGGASDSSDPFSLAPFKPPKQRRRPAGSNRQPAPPPQQPQQIQRPPSKPTTRHAFEMKDATANDPDSDFDPRAGELPRTAAPVQPSAAPPAPTKPSQPRPSAVAVAVSSSSATSVSTPSTKFISSPSRSQRRPQPPVDDRPLPQIGVTSDDGFAADFFDASDDEAGASLVASAAGASSPPASPPPLRSASLSSPSAGAVGTAAATPATNSASVAVKPKSSGRFRSLLGGGDASAPAAASTAPPPASLSSSAPSAAAVTQQSVPVSAAPAAPAADLPVSGSGSVVGGGGGSGKKAKKKEKVAAAFANLSFVDFDSGAEDGSGRAAASAVD
ncbi:hypothetical protein BOX15_Mlig021406g1 [Macrostomum lignano]|uniref:non-specific serine/threonine protein kinase n=1 Tax=Macrostomum lignano TaxID=282301 RepID=A0A267H1Q5_9PLAT|nr:hypothetical protein BOX15_Mlig021406g1 [Macrostomum lignano]